jgi:Flp pilus assembly pilin Flp
MTTFAHRFIRNEDGQDLIEYALLCSFVALACTAAVAALGTAISNVFTVVAAQLENAD